jgi:hypothetical protein
MDPGRRPPRPVPCGGAMELGAALTAALALASAYCPVTVVIDGLERLRPASVLAPPLHATCSVTSAKDGESVFRGIGGGMDSLGWIPSTLPPFSRLLLVATPDILARCRRLSSFAVGPSAGSGWIPSGNVVEIRCPGALEVLLDISKSVTFDLRLHTHQL